MLDIRNIKIEWKTVCDQKLNLDSITSWNNDILVTSKDSHNILAFDNETGKLKYKFGGKGYDHDKFNKPNGIKLINDYLFIVEKDNKRCQIIDMKTKESISFFGFKKLKKPCGIDGIFLKNQYIIFITDEKLECIFKFNIKIEDDEIKRISSSIFLELSGSKLESVLLDNENNRLLIADEDRKKIKIFSLNGILIKVISNIFEGSPEGLVMTNDSYIFTDQVLDKAFFHVFDISNFEYKYTYFNNLIKNTDGIYFKDKFLYAIDNNCSLTKLNLKKVDNGFSNILLAGLLIAIFQKLY